MLPVGSTEQHGHHLPLGVDTYMPEAICRQVAERSSCLLAPSIPYGVSPHHTFKPGTVTVESETFRRYVRDVCRSAGEWGIENVLLVTVTTSYKTPNSKSSCVTCESITICVRFTFHL